MEKVDLPEKGSNKTSKQQKIEEKNSKSTGIERKALLEKTTKFLPKH